MAAEQAPLGYFVTSGRYTREALAWAEGKPLTLINGIELVGKLNELDSAVREQLIAEVTEGDYETPSCPRCEIKLVRRSSRFGEFWGCPNFGNRRSKCSYKRAIKASGR